MGKRPDLVLRARLNVAQRSVAFLRYKRQLAAAFAKGDAHLRDVQRHRLACMTDVYERVPFQRDRLREAGIAPNTFQPASLGAIAPLGKSELLARDPMTLAVHDETSRRVVSKATSGSSGQPFRFLLDRTSMDRGRAVRAFIYDRLGYRGGPIVELFDARRDGPNARGRRGAGTPTMDRHTVAYRLPLDEQVDIIERLDPGVLYGNRSHLMLIADELTRRGHRLPRLQIVVSSSETLQEHDRRVLSEALTSKVHDLYGMAEFETIAWEEASGFGYQVLACRVVVEVLRDGQPAAPGEVGELTVTGLDNRIMPLLRYATGDLARVPDTADEPRQGGTSLTRIERIEGRCDDCLVTTDGRLVSPWQVSTSSFWGSPMIAAHVYQWQIEQDEHLDVTVTVVPVAGASVPNSTQDDIAAFVQEALGMVKVAVVSNPTVRRDSNGKFRPVKSRATTRSISRRQIGR